MKRLFLLVLILVLSSCSTKTIKPPELERTFIPNDKALVKLNFTISNQVPSLALVRKTEFVAPIVELGDASKLLAFKEGSGPVLIDRTDISKYYGYRLEPVQTVNAFGSFGQAHLNLLLAKKLWQYSQGKNITIAVIDSGIDKNQKSLIGVSFAGFNFLDNNNKLFDESGHGTAISTLIAGRGPYFGIAPEAKILPLKVLDKYNQGSNYDVTRAILYAADLLEDMPNPNPVDIINLSLGSFSYSPVMHDAIKRATSKGIVIIAAAGNSGKNEIAYPAALPEVISVGAAQLLSEEWSLMPYSNYGKYGDILAPMGGYAKTNWGQYAETGLLTAKANSSNSKLRVHGTSFASAEVSAVMALLMSMGSNSQEAKEILLASAVDIDKTGWDNKFAFGILSPLAALRSANLKSNSKNLVIKFLDASSQQEEARFFSDAEISIHMTPGKYKIFAFADSNHDNLWQSFEAFYYSDSFSLKAKEIYQEDIALRFQ